MQPAASPLQDRGISHNLVSSPLFNRAVTMGTRLQTSDVMERMLGVQGEILSRGQLESYLGTAAEWP